MSVCLSCAAHDNVINTYLQASHSYPFKEIINQRIKSELEENRLSHSSSVNQMQLKKEQKRGYLFTKTIFFFCACLLETTTVKTGIMNRIGWDHQELLQYQPSNYTNRYITESYFWHHF